MAKYPNNGPMDQCFYSAGTLKSLFAAIGYDFEISQLSPGALEGRFRLGGSRLVPLMSITTNQVLVFEGGRRAGWLPFCISTSSETPLVRGNEVPQMSMHGFCSDLQDAFFQLPAGCHLQIALVSRERMEQLALAANEHHALDLISSTNSARLPAERFDRLSKILQPSQSDPFQGELIEAELLDLLSQRDVQRLSTGELNHRADLMKHLISWGQSNPTSVISLEDLTATIFASRSSIVHNCRSMFGIGPMALLKRIRLGQVQNALLNPDQRALIGCRTVQEVANHFGFQSRNHFARDYRDLFGEAPSATLQRSGGNGILCQPVSVAQSPQMAMARR